MRRARALLTKGQISVQEYQARMDAFITHCIGIQVRGGECEPLCVACKPIEDLATGKWQLPTHPPPSRALILTLCPLHLAAPAQEGLDIDVLVHGEAERTDMVEFFGEQLEGLVFTANAWVQVKIQGLCEG